MSLAVLKCQSQIDEGRVYAMLHVSSDVKEFTYGGICRGDIDRNSFISRSNGFDDPGVRASALGNARVHSKQASVAE
jgi:hypothetical protein